MNNLSGLSWQEVKKRRAQFGLNQIEKTSYRGLAKIVFGQLSNFLILLLVAATVISFLVADMADFYILLAVIAVNVIMGTFQEYRAEKALEALEKILPVEVKVVRNGEADVIEAKNLVPDDIVILSSGDQVPADCQVIESTQLKVNEAMLTGESRPNKKSTEDDDKLFSGTTVVSGRAKAKVTATGPRAKIGQIASHISVQGEMTPLQKKLIYLGKVLAVITGILSALIFLMGILSGFEFYHILIYSVSILVSAVPESLPIVTTLALALGVIKLAREKAITRHLPALETLGTIDVIASDKTGTLTRNQMTVKEVWTSKQRYQVEGVGYEPKGEVVAENGELIKEDSLPADLEKIIKAGAICNDADLSRSKKSHNWQVIGDPTEGALQVLAKKANLFKNAKCLERVNEIPFNSQRKMMSVVVDENRNYIGYSKGAPEVVIKKAKYILRNGQKQKMSQKDRQLWLDRAYKQAQRGLRVLAVGRARTGRFDSPEKGLVFLGLVAMIDPPLPESAQALREADNLGVKTIIITGDHKLTAKWVVEQLGMKIEEKEIATGGDLKKMTDDELLKKVNKIKLWARISPFQKQKIIKALKDNNLSVAVTGDGVNDAPALKKADVGIAMGQQGTDVARQSADIVLQNDHFSAIVSTIKYGRTIYDNIKKFFTFLLSGNFDEILLVTAAFLFSLPQPFTAGQILWINLITDSFPAMALAFEKPNQKDLSGPRDPEKGVIKPILKYALFIGAIALAFSFIALLYFQDIDHSRLRTYIFTIAVMVELFAVFSVRSKKPFWQESPFKNKMLVLAVAFSFILQLIAIYSPLNQILKTTPLGLNEWIMIIGIAVVSYLIIELTKYFRPDFLSSN